MKGAFVPGLVFAAIGVPFAAVGLLLAAQRARVVASWPEAAAVVTDSKVETRGSRHAARIDVRFETPDGLVETAALHDHRYSRHASIAEAVERFPRGADVFVRYDPDDPQRARLDAGFNLATFGLPLLLFGAAASCGGIALLALRSGRLQVAAKQAKTARARKAAERKDARTVALFVLAIGISFVVAGTAIFPAALGQRGWPQRDARVERADVYARYSSHPRPGKSGSTRYHVRLFLAYEHEGRRYVSPVNDASSRHKQEAEQIAASIPKGERRLIKVDPERPNRIAKLDAWPLVLPTAFLGVGLVVSAVAVWLFRL